MSISKSITMDRRLRLCVAKPGSEIILAQGLKAALSGPYIMRVTSGDGSPMNNWGWT